MAEQVRTCNTTTSLLPVDPGELFAGADMTLQVQVTCVPAGDLHGKIVRIVTQHADVLKEVALAATDATTGETGEFVVKAPVAPGEYTWTATFPAQTAPDGTLLAESAALISFVVKPHGTSIAVWGVPAPVVVDTDFRVNVGVKCAAGCNLGGQVIEIYDHEGARVATGALGDSPYSDTLDLYWTEVALRSPVAPKAYRWAVRLPGPELELPHNAAALEFGFNTANPPEHSVVIKVTNQQTGAPVENARVTFRPYSGNSDTQGEVRLETTGGDYKLYVSHSEYDAYQAPVSVSGAATIHVALTPAKYEVDYRGNLWKVTKKK